MNYPFAAIVGQERMRQALLLAATDPALSVLLQGEKGSAKTTAARALAELLPEGAPFVNLPIGTGEERLLGGLDLDKALSGQPALKPGLLSQAHGGVLYIDEVNLLAPHLTDALLDVVVSGVGRLEREGFSLTYPARFVLLASMNPEEGRLRPQLFDRFALKVEVAGLSDPEERALAVERRLAFEQNPEGFRARFHEAQQALRERLQAARARLPGVALTPELLQEISRRVAALGIGSLRPDLALARAARALAAWEGKEVDWALVEAVWPLVLPEQPSPPPPPPPAPTPKEAPAFERTFAPRLPPHPLRLEAPQGPSARAVLEPEPERLALRASLLHLALRKGERLERQDLHTCLEEGRASPRLLLVVDASGSLAAQARMAWAKGALLRLLEETPVEVGLITFRGSGARLVLPFTRDLEAARRTLEHLPAGGRTPLAAALALALEHLDERTRLVLVTDGRANVPHQGGDPWAEALALARRIRGRAAVLDAEAGPSPLGRARQLAEAMGAVYARLEDLNDHALLLRLGV
ncbi:VWA domain-containing protein [Meiothermus sp. QL-1]|uniref:ATP-binding protein n=1 Tax=Meiothermus sp. QL-1 TaxID=2058095 RepID=UPI000E0CBB5D|nr:ATP-binding protein [Meiothermus sp. QL-1]RDI95877.1 VWA domain-containing protein [Meiothermus sp. QL-1]